MPSETQQVGKSVDWRKWSFFLTLACVVFGLMPFKGPLIEIKLPPAPPTVEQPTRQTTKQTDLVPPAPKGDATDWDNAYADAGIDWSRWWF